MSIAGRTDRFIAPGLGRKCGSLMVAKTDYTSGSRDADCVVNAMRMIGRAGLGQVCHLHLCLDAVLLRKSSGQLLELAFAARDQYQIEMCCRKAMGKGLANTGRGTGDKCCANGSWICSEWGGVHHGG